MASRMQVVSCSISAATLLLVASLNAPRQLRADSPDKLLAKHSRAWLPEARGYTEELAALARDTPRIGTPSPDDDQLTWFSTAQPQMQQLSENWRKGDALLWKLWLATGQSPRRHQGQLLHEYLQENAAVYDEYISKHADLSDEAIVRLGLLNCVETIASPRWYKTIRYLQEKTGFRTIRHDGGVWYIRISASPSTEMVEDPLPQESYERLQDAFKRWLAKDMGAHHMDSMIQDRRVASFRRSNPCVGCAELTEVVLEEMHRGIVHRKKEVEVRQRRQESEPTLNE